MSMPDRLQAVSRRGCVCTRRGSDNRAFTLTFVSELGGGVGQRKVRSCALPISWLPRRPSRGRERRAERGGHQR